MEIQQDQHSESEKKLRPRNQVIELAFDWGNHSLITDFRDNSMSLFNIPLMISITLLQDTLQVLVRS